jgi:predicted transcriptional regulator
MLKIPCNACRGTGRVPLPKELLETLEEVRNGHRTAIDIWARSDDRKNINVTAVNRRLERLRSLGLLKRKKGPARAYSYTETPKKRKHRNG